MLVRLKVLGAHADPADTKSCGFTGAAQTDDKPQLNPGHAPRRDGTGFMSDPRSSQLL